MTQRRTLQDLIKQRQASKFVGRRAELALFEENVRLPVADHRRQFLFSVHGDAGVGKTFLIQQFIRIAREHGYLTARVDESVQDTPSAMERIVADLAQQGRQCKDFSKRLAEWQQHRHELHADPNAPAGLSSVLTRSAVRVGLRAAEGVPLVGPFAKELNSDDAMANQVDQVRTYLSRKLRNPDDLRLMLSPVDELSTTFVRELRSITEQQPVALFFDTYERTGAFLDRWLLDLLSGRHGELPLELLLTTAGQHPLDVNVWADYVGIRSDIAVQLFTDAEARELLARQGVTSEKVIEVILGLTNRLPVLVALLAEKAPDTVDDVIDPSGDAVERFLKWEDDEQRRLIALRGALPRRVDRETLSVAVDSPVGDEDFAWLRGMPFVSEHSDSYYYHDVVRSAMLRVQRRDSMRGWRELHTRLAEHYRSVREELGLAEDGAAWLDARWQNLSIEEHYHRLCVEGASALSAALGGFALALRWHEQLAPLWGGMIRQAGADTDTQVLINRGEQLASWSTAEVEDKIRVLTALSNEASFADHHRAAIYAERGNLYRKGDREEEALTDLNRAIELDPTDEWITGQRAEMHRLRRRNEEAIADFDRTIELNPNYAWALGGRGSVHLFMDNYELALSDLTRAIELEPEYAWAIAQRGLTYRFIDEYDNALNDFNRAIELNPEYGWAIGGRGQVHRRMGNYDQALADFNRRLDLYPHDKWAIAERGRTYRMMNQLDAAIADLTSAIELDPEYDWAFDMRAEVYRLLHDYDRALADLQRSHEIDPQSGWTLYQIALVRFAQGHVQDAHAALRGAVERDRAAIEELPRDAWRAFNVAVYLLALGDGAGTEREIRETLAHAPSPHDVAGVIDDLKELHAELGVPVDHLLVPLRAHLPSA